MAKSSSQLDREIEQVLALEVGDRVESGKRGTAEHDTGTVISVQRARGGDRGADLVRVHWKGAQATYNDDARDLRKLG